MDMTNELLKITERLESQSKKLEANKFKKPLEQLTEAAEHVSQAWSGSWLGYHARVYYSDFTEPPRRAHFSKEWGLMHTTAIKDISGSWVEYQFNEVISFIKDKAGNPSINKQEKESKSVKGVLEELQSQILSLISGIQDNFKDDKFFNDIYEKIKELKVFGESDFVEFIRPKGQVMSRDMVALQAGCRTPPHISIIAQIKAIKHPFTACEDLSKLVRRIASHIQNVDKHKKQDERIGTNVFIGHGGSAIWKDLKDFIQDRMHLPWDEFNRVPVAGYTNIARLSQMLDEAAIAFLIMTAEDEQADGKQHARQNVIHEAGLFQGCLGFERAIILLEEGCEEFFNVQGLGQIRFPKGNIFAVFEDIRKVLEREGLIDEA